MAIYLSDLLDSAPHVQITGICLDSRKVQQGDLFLALAGTKQDGRAHIADALAKGAAAVVYEAQGAQVAVTSTQPLIALDNLADKVSALAGRFYGNPSQALCMLGVTGTNGKSSVSQLLAQALDLLARKCAIIGTLGNGFYGNLHETGHTTPDPVSLQADLAALKAQGAQAVSMEVSSHALDQGRVAGLQFDVALFTNLSRDHLDYHGSMQAYGAAKAKLFSWQGLKARVLNLDDKFAAELANSQGTGELITYSIENSQATIYCQAVSFTDHGIYATVIAGDQQGELHSPLLGRFNLSNLLAVVGGLWALGFDLAQILAVMPKLEAPAGRMQRVGGHEKPLVVVDYAHTPDALEQVLKALRAHVHGDARLVAVFGCGGDRDAGKRPLMAQAVESYADFGIVTDDNPRTENAQAIRQQVAAGFLAKASFNVVDGRAQAIAQAIAQAQAGDVILLAGKGHEDYQDIQGVKHHFSDIEQAQIALANWEAAHV